MSKDADEVNIRNSLTERSYNLDLEGLCRLCKQVVEENEGPQRIEIEPLEAPGSPHLRGEVGNEIFVAEFGVHIFQAKNPIPAAAIEEISTHFRRAGCQFGTLISLSDFEEAAIQEARDLDGMTLTLIDGEELVDLLIDSNIGVRREDGWKIDGEFWRQFETSPSSDLIPSRQIPQADSLERIVPTLTAVEKGYDHKSAIGEFLRRNTDTSVSDRQSHYYATAAELLNLLKHGTEDVEDTTVRNWELTREGYEYLERADSSDYVDQEYLQSVLPSLKIIQRIEERLSPNERFNHDDLVTIIKEETDINDETVERRATSLGKWFWIVQGKIKRPDRNRRAYEYYPEGGLDSYY